MSVRVRVFRFLAVLVAVLLLASQGSPGVEALLDAGTMEMIAELLRSPDRELRGLALQQIRSEWPGEAATKAFAELGPKLPTEAYTGLIEALAERGDATARPAVIEAAAHREMKVRAAALKALGFLSGPGDVPLLVGRLAASEPERGAAQAALSRLVKPGVEAVLFREFPKAPSHVQPALLQIFSARRMTNAFPLVLRSLQGTNAVVRVAAWQAVPSVASSAHSTNLLEVLTQLSEADELAAAEKSLVGFPYDSATEAFMERSLQQATAPSRLVLLRLLAASGGSRALAALQRISGQPSGEVSDTAVRLLAEWRDESAKPVLMQLARSAGNRVQRQVALRGLIRLAGTEGGRLDMAMLEQSWELAAEPAEKRLILAAISNASESKAFNLVRRGLAVPELAEESALCGVQIAERLKSSDLGAARSLLEEIVAKTKKAEIRERSTKLLRQLPGS